jgi:hypothetical protein
MPSWQSLVRRLVAVASLRRGVGFCSDRPYELRGGDPAKGFEAVAAGTRRNVIVSPSAPADAGEREKKGGERVVRKGASRNWLASRLTTV